MCDIGDALFRPVFALTVNLVALAPVQRLGDSVGCSLHQIPLDVACISAACSERKTHLSDFSFAEGQLTQAS